MTTSPTSSSSSSAASSSSTGAAAATAKANEAVSDRRPFNLLDMMLPIDEIAETFHDLIPIAQNDGPDPVCVIQYPTGFVIAYDYMRACWKVQEYSLRSLQLSATCLKLNPANYTVWHYRRDCLQALGLVRLSMEPPTTTTTSTSSSPSSPSSPQLIQKAIRNDLQLAASLGGENPKNYQIWYHRRALLEAYHNSCSTMNSNLTTTTQEEKVVYGLEGDFLQTELDYLEQVLDQDAKNYHAWSHRQWLLRTVNLPRVWEQELDYAHQLIQKDPRNNSAWNQRWFVIHHHHHLDGVNATSPPTTALSIEQCRQEADYAIQHGAKLDPYNESPFRYLIALLREQEQQQQEEVSASTFSTSSSSSSTNTTMTHSAAALYQEYHDKVQNDIYKILVEAGRNPNACVPWISAKIDLLQGARNNGNDNDDDNNKKKKTTTTNLSMAITLAQTLATQYDIIRTKYWQLRIRQLEDQLSSSGME